MTALRALATVWCVRAAFACIPLGVGLAIASGGFSSVPGAEELDAGAGGLGAALWIGEVILGVLLPFGGALVALYGAFALGTSLLAAALVRARRGRSLCLFLSACHLPLAPFGTAAGVVSLVVLLRDDAADAFAAAARERRTEERLRRL